MGEQFLTPENALTITACASVTYLIVANTKYFIKAPLAKLKASKDAISSFIFIYSVVIATAILVVAQYALGKQLVWFDFIFAGLNGIIVSATAGKMNDQAQDSQSTEELFRVNNTKREQLNSITNNSATNTIRPENTD